MPAPAPARLRLIGFRPAEISALTQRRVIEEHITEAAFLWSLRERASRAPHYRLKHLARLDGRVIAHLEGARLAGDIGFRLAQTQLDQGDPGAMFVLAYLAFAEHEPGKIRRCLQLGLAHAPFLNPLHAALSWLELEQVRPHLDALLTAPEPGLHFVALSALRAHRSDPGEALSRALASPDAALRIQAVRAIGELRRADLREPAHAALRDAHPDVRFWAGWALALLGDVNAAAFAFRAAGETRTHATAALGDIFRCADPGWTQDTVRSLAQSPQTQRWAILGAGALGDPVSVPWLLRHLGDPALARVAAEAFSMITGADLDIHSLKRDAPEDLEAPPSPEDADLPWPDTDAVVGWWNRKRRDFASGQRYLCGQPVLGGAAYVLRAGYQRQRRAAAVELARQQPGAPLFPVGDRADWQRQRLGS